MDVKTLEANMELAEAKLRVAEMAKLKLYAVKARATTWAPSPQQPQQQPQDEEEQEQRSNKRNSSSKVSSGSSGIELMPVSGSVRRRGKLQ